MVKVIEAEHIEKMFAKMIDTPSKANQWLDAMRDLFKYAIKRKLLVVNPATDIEQAQVEHHIADGTPELGRRKRSPRRARNSRSAARCGSPSS